MISKLVIIGLILIWAVVLLPDVYARIASSRRRDTIRSFNQQLSSLGRSAPVSRPDNVIEFRSRLVSPLAPLTPAAPEATAPPAPEPEPPGRPAPALRATAGPTGSPRAVRRAPVTAGDRRPARPVSPALRKRRQDVLMVLGAAALLTLLATMSFGGIFLFLHVVSDLLLAAYLVLLQRATASPQAAPRRRVARIRPPAGLPGALAPLGRTADLEPRRIAN